MLTGCGGVTNRNGVIICEDLLIAKEEIVFKSKVKNKHKGDGNIEKLKVLSLFSGIGAFEGGLERLGIDFELVGISEIDVHALVAYAAIHCNLLNYEHLFDLEDDIDNKREYIKPLGLIKSNKPINVDKLKARELNSIYYACKLTSNLGDISEVESLLDYKDKADLIVGGSPCQDFSIAGKQQGSIFKCLDCESEFNPLVIHHTKRDFCPKCNSINLEKTRSSLLIEYLRTIREVRPKYFIYENVKNIVGKKFKKAFDMFNDELQEYGYNTYYQILNAKDYGIPQNRERVFVIGIREDVDKGDFKFPEPFDSGLRLKDLLQDEVEEKYYINNDRVDELLSRLKDGKLGHYPNVGAEPLSSSALSSREYRASGWSEGIGTLCARDYKDPKVIAEPQIVAERGRYNEDRKIKQQLEVQKSGNSNALTTVQKDNLVLEPNKIIQINDPNHFSQRVYSKEGIAPTIAAGNRGGGKEPCKIIEENNSNELKFVGGIGEKEWVEDGKKLSRNYPQGNRVYDVNGVACSQTAQGGGIGSVTGLYLEERVPNEIHMIEVEQLVRVRKHEVDTERLIACLRDFKAQSKLTNRQISEQLDQPITLVEHWFRRDSSFAIPDADVWYELKELLDIKTDEFDKPITEFIEKEGVYEKGNRYYHEGGIAPTLTTSANERIIEQQKSNELQLFTNLSGGKWDKIHESARRVYDEEGIAPTVPTCGGGNIEPKVQTNYKIRKLTPLECWRLMNFNDEDYWNARKALESTYYNGRDRSNSQMYKMAGNSIVVNVLVEIYKNLLEEYIIE